MDTPLPAFVHGLRGKEMVFQAGQALDAPGLSWIRRGQVGLWQNGGCLFTAGPGDSFGEAGLFSSANPYQPVALTEGLLIHYPARGLLLHLRVHADLALSFAAFLAERLDQLRLYNEILRHRGADERILTYLRSLGADQQVVEISGTLHGLAGKLGLTHESLYRTLRQLQQEGRLLRPSQREFQLPPSDSDHQ